MDFRICPSCEQSVLEDDVEDCPFCGASMSGKPSPKSKSSSPANSKAKKEAPPSKGAQPKQAKPEPKESKSDSDASADPFEVKSQASKKAPKMKQSMTSSCRLEVLCPMCESVGFVPTSYEGREVRCHNSECLVPVFTVPKQEIIEETDDRSLLSKYGLFIGLGVVVLGTIGGLVYSLQDNKKKDVDPINPATNIVDDKPKVDPDKKDPVVTPENKVPDEPKFSKSEIQEEALRQLSISSRQETQNRSRALLKRMAAQGYVFTGNLEEAEKQLESLRNDQKAASFLQVLPLVDMAWHHIEKGDTDKSKKELETALKIASTLPRNGEETAYFVTALVTALLAVDMDSQAEEFLKNYPISDDSALWGCTQRVIVKNRSFDAFLESQVPYNQLTKKPISVAAVRGLIASGKSEKALKWTLGQKDSRRQFECKMGFLTGKLLSNNQAIQLTDGEFGHLTEGMTPTHTAFTWGYRANLEMLIGQKEKARTSIAKAKESWANITLPKEFEVPGMEEIHDEGYEANDVASLRLAGLTAALIIKAELQSEAKEDLKAAWTSVVKGIELAQRIGASPEKINALDSKNSSQQSSIQRQLKNVFKLETDSEARRAFNKYRRNVSDLKKLSDLRQSIIVRILREAADAGLGKKIWESVSKKEAPFDKNDGLLETEIAGVLFTHLKESEATDALNEFKSEFQNLAVRYPYYWETQRIMSRLSKNDDTTAAFNSYPKRVLSKVEERRLGVEIACLLAQSQNIDKTIDWILRHRDSIVREQAIQFASGILATQKNAKEFTSKVDRALFNPLEKGISNLSVLQKISEMDDLK